jgi:hypothetical protein
MRFAALALFCVACRAQVGDAADFSGDDLTPPSDLAASPDDAIDLAGVDLWCAGPPVAEICGNGCDDDKNGYTDADDPACTPQLLGTSNLSSLPLYRYFLQPLQLKVLDGNAVKPGSFAVVDRSLVGGVAFIATEAAPGNIRRIMLTSDGSKGTFTDYSPGYVTRDVCVFNGELIVVERAQQSVLHRLMADGKTSVMPNPTVALPTFVSDGTVMATACTGGDGRLIVAAHDLVGNPSQFIVYTSLAVAPTLVNMPASLVAAAPSIDRCLDLAWAPTGFYGLFVASGGSLNDPTLNATQILPFALDGAVGPPIDAGTLHGLGSFLP